MMNSPFAAKQSGMASMFESIIPADVLEAIKVAKEQLPAVIDNVQLAVKRIEDKLNHIDSNVTMLMIKVYERDPNYVPDNSQLAQPTVTNSQADNGHVTGD